MAKESHVSSYENLKEIFTGHKQKLLNFFAKKSIYDDDKVTMQSQYSNAKKQNFIYNWYDNQSQVLNTSNFFGNIVIGHKNMVTNSLGYIFDSNCIVGHNNTMSEMCNNDNVYGYSNYIDYVTKSSVFGRGNYISRYTNSYSTENIGDSSCVHIDGQENGCNSNVTKAFYYIHMNGSGNYMYTSRTSLTEQHQSSSTNIAYPSVYSSSLYGFDNTISLETKDSNDASVHGYNVNDFELGQIHMFGATNEYSSNNPGTFCISGEGVLTLVGIHNSSYNLKNSLCVGHLNRLGFLVRENDPMHPGHIPSSADLSYNLFIFGYNNECQCGSSYNIVLNGVNNSINSTSNNIYMYGYHNYTSASSGNTLVGMDNHTDRAGQGTNIFGSSNSVYGSTTVTDNTIVGTYNYISANNDIHFGNHLVSNYDDQIAIGNYNENSDSNYLEIGNGVDNNHRHNVAVITRTGDLYLNDGDVINENGESLATLRTDIDLLDGRVETLEGKVEDLEDAVDNIEDDVEALGTRVGNNETDIETLQGQVRDLTLALADALARISELENIVMNEKTNHVQLYTEDGDTRITEDGDNKFTEEVLV